MAGAQADARRPFHMMTNKKRGGREAASLASTRGGVSRIRGNHSSASMAEAEPASQKPLTVESVQSHVMREAVRQLQIKPQKRSSAPPLGLSIPPPLQCAGLFAGIGGIELGLSRGGHETDLLCEIDRVACAVLESRFPRVKRVADVQQLKSLPHGTELVAAGFPCQDLSQAGRTAGITGSRSSLVGEVFRLLESKRVEWVLLENVPFMLQLAGGRALDVIVTELESLGYR